MISCRPPVAFSSTEMAAVQSRLGRVTPAEHIHRVRFSTDHLGPAPLNPLAAGNGERPSKLRRLKTGAPQQQQPRSTSHPDVAHMCSEESSLVSLVPQKDVPELLLSA